MSSLVRIVRLPCYYVSKVASDGQSTTSALVCSKCDATVPDKTALDTHMREVHKAQGKHICQKCKAVFAAVSAL